MAKVVERFVVADRRGVKVGELEPELDSVLWVLNGVGEVRLSLARSDAKATLDFLRFGNVVMMEFANGLPVFGGVIDPPRVWDGQRIGVSVFSGEYLMGMRMTNRGRYFSGASVGYIFEQLIEEANAVQDTLIDVGEVWTGGGRHSPDYHFRSLLDIAQKSIGGRLTPADFWLEPVETDGLIRFRAHLVERRGRELQAALVEERNLGSVKMIENGPILNDWALVGEGTTWGDERLIVYATDGESRAEYGLRQRGEILGDVSEEETLQSAAEERAGRMGGPRVMLELEHLDEGPSGFADVDLGDVVSVSLHNYGFQGFEGRVRIMARDFAPRRGTCKLVVEEVASDE